jgi:Kef-type K+ transport system membrane component KefB
MRPTGMRPTLRFALLAPLLIGAPALGSEGAEHHDPVALLVIQLAVILVVAKVGGDLAARLRQPPVLGELLAGVLLGNIHHVGLEGFAGIGADPTVDMLARLGVIILLFEVGLESTVAQMMKVGSSALLVATVGVVAPLGLGFAVGHFMLPEDSLYTHIYLGATLCATSVGITARVLKDLNASQRQESRIILGAAVIDDVQGLVVLAVVAGVITAANTGTEVSVLDAAIIVGKATFFLVGSLVLGAAFSRRLFRVASYLRSRGVLLATGLTICFVFAWAADAIGLAPIVGAFAAGLILEEVHYTDFRSKGEHELEELVQPISYFLVPIFFVLMGMRTDLTAFAKPSVLGLAAVLTIAAIIGKQVCGLAALPDKTGAPVDRLTIGIGMIPRGEVGLIFANIGLTLSVGGVPVVSPDVFSACVVMVIVTTMITPPLLRFSLLRAERKRAGPSAGGSPPEPSLPVD